MNIMNMTGLSLTLMFILDPELYVPFVAPNVNATGAGGGQVFLADGVDLNLTAATAPAPVNLTALNETVPSEVTSTPSAPVPSTTGNSSAGGTGSNGAAGLESTSKVMTVALAGALAALALVL